MSTSSLVPVTDSKLRICSLNMHGFNNGFSMANLLCDSHDIILLQETWLQSCDLDKLNSIHSEFSSFGLSSMVNKCASNIITGRPFGGVAIIWRKNLSSCLKILDYDSSDGRYLSIRINQNTVDYVITCVYFPCISSNSKNDYIVSASQIIAHIESMLSNFPMAGHVVAGDYNFECINGNIGFELFKNTISTFGLICCDSLNASHINSTYHHDTLGHASWLDHVFISGNIKQSLVEFNIIDSGACLSDHFPISSALLTNLTVDNSVIKVKHAYKCRWDKADLILYYYNTAVNLQSIVIPNAVLHCSAGCTCSSHCQAIDDYYNAIVGVLHCSSQNCVPKIPHNCLKSFWNEELDKLKESSMDMHNLWRLIGSPRQGVINAARIKSKLEYKQAIKRTAAAHEQDNADDLHGHFINKDTTSFWKCWNSKYKKSANAQVSVAGKSDPACIANEFKTYFANIYVKSCDDLNSVNEYITYREAH